MISLIVDYIDKEGRPYIMIGNRRDLEVVKKTSKQIISLLAYEHSEEAREYILDLSEGELVCALRNIQKENPLHRIYPS